ncbi:MAG TPA: hypothetical protein VGH80_07740 [Xanthomonadaceae bacterium]|jgi:hypothetical protein
MTHSLRAGLAVATTILLLVTGCKGGHGQPSGDDADSVRAQEADCEHEIDIKNVIFVKACLDKRQLTSRVAEAKALLAQTSKERTDSIARLANANPDVLALLKKWDAAKTSDPMLFAGIHINLPEPLQLPYGSSHQVGIDQNAVVNDLESRAKDKLLDTGFANGSACTGPVKDLEFDVTVAVRDSGDSQQIEFGNEKDSIHVLAYDVDIVACYGDERVQVAAIRDQRMELPEGLQIATDPAGANFQAERLMDQKAQDMITASIGGALGLR